MSNLDVLLLNNNIYNYGVIEDQLLTRKNKKQYFYISFIAKTFSQDTQNAVLICQFYVLIQIVLVKSRPTDPVLAFLPLESTCPNDIL